MRGAALALLALALCARTVPASASERTPAGGNTWVVVLLAAQTREPLDDIARGEVLAPSVEAASGLHVFESDPENFALVAHGFPTEAEAVAAAARIATRYPGAYAAPIDAPALALSLARAAHRAHEGTAAHADHDAERIATSIPLDGVDPDSSGLGSGRRLPAVIERHRAPFSPDDRVLWAMLHQGELDRLARTIATWRKRKPGWRPPRALMDLAAEARDARALALARERGDWTRVLALTERTLANDAALCARLDLAFARDEALAAIAHDDERAGQAERIATRCPEWSARIAAIKHAQGALPAALALRVTDTAIDRAPEPAEASRLRALRHAWGRGLLHASLALPDDHEALAWEGALAGDIIDARDADAALALGWRHLEAKRLDQAAGWFGRARAWSPQDADAGIGLALARAQAGRVDDALSVLATIDEADTRARALEAGLLVTRAATRHEAADAAGCVHDLERALALGAGEDARSLYGWCLLGAGRHDEAAALFEARYREAPSEDAARALRAAHDARGDLASIDRVAADVGGPLALARRAERADAALASGRPLLAHWLAPERHPLLARVDAPRVAARAGWRARTGEAGAGQLDALALPAVVADAVWGGVFRFALRVDRIDLDAGAGVRASSLTEPRIYFRGEGELSPYAEIGTTPLGAEIDSTPVGRAGLSWDEGRHAVLAELVREPVRDSLLAWVGMRDPSSGALFGRVTRTGARAAGRTMPRPWIALEAEISLSRLEGEGVASNGQFAVRAQALRAFRAEDFAHLGVGAALRFESYRRDLSRFDPGHGGYFSPRSIVNAGLVASAETRHDPRVVARGAISLGWERHTHRDTPVLPLADDGRVYEGYEADGIAGSLELSAVWRLAPHWQIGVGAAWRRSAEWQETGAALTLRYVLGERLAVFAADLPDAPL